MFLGLKKQKQVQQVDVKWPSCKENLPNNYSEAEQTALGYSGFLFTGNI